MERPGAAAAEDEEDERANHGEIGAGVTDHEPEPLGMGEFGEFGTGDGGRDNKEKWDSSEAGPKAEEDERAADDFETADEVRREGGLRKADASERSTPILGSVNLRRPWVKKIRPTARRMTKILGGPVSDWKKKRRSAFMVKAEYKCRRAEK